MAVLRMWAHVGPLRLAKDQTREPLLPQETQLSLLAVLFFFFFFFSFPFLSSFVSFLILRLFGFEHTGTARPGRGRTDSNQGFRPEGSTTTVISSGDWDTDIAATTVVTPQAAPVTQATPISQAAPVAAPPSTAAVAPAPTPAQPPVNSWSNKTPPWSQPKQAAVTAAPAVPVATASAPAPQPTEEKAVPHRETQQQQPVAAAPAASVPAQAPQATVPHHAAPPATVDAQPQQTSSLFDKVPAPSQSQQQQPPKQPQVSASQTTHTPPAAQPSHIVQTSLRMPTAHVTTLSDAENALHNPAAYPSPFGQGAKGNFGGAKDNSPVVLPSNAAIQGLDLRFGTLGLGVEELSSPSPTPAAPQQNGASAAQSHSQPEKR